MSRVSSFDVIIAKPDGTEDRRTVGGWEYWRGGRLVLREDGGETEPYGPGEWSRLTLASCPGQPLTNDYVRANWDLAAAAAFEAGFAARSGVTVEQMHFQGRYAEPCYCDYAGCTGWALGHQWEDAIAEDQMRSSLAS